MKLDSLELLNLLRLSSQALPVGAYAYSQGLEAAIEAGFVQSADDTGHWLKGLLTQGYGRLDLPVLVRLVASWQEDSLESALVWNALLAGFRETEELLLEDQQLGRAFYRLLQSEENGPDQWPVAEIPCFATMFAYAAVHHHIDLVAVLHGFSWSWLENLVGVATKIVPLGQTAAQRLLRDLSRHIEPVCNTALRMTDEEIGYSLPGLAILSSNHERQYVRLFRS